MEPLHHTFKYIKLYTIKATNTNSIWLPVTIDKGIRMDFQDRKKNVSKWF